MLNGLEHCVNFKSFHGLASEVQAQIDMSHVVSAGLWLAEIFMHKFSLR